MEILRKRAGQRPRLDRTDWVRAGHELLVASGPKALTIGRVAEFLGVTTGSFYWHFKSRSEYLAALYEGWLRDVIEPAAARAAASDADGRSQLAALGKVLAARRLPRLDGAMREWALSDAGAAAAVERADAMRVSYLAGFFRAAGLESEVAQQRAEIAMWCWAGSYRVSGQLDAQVRAKRFGSLVALLSVDSRGDS